MEPKAGLAINPQHRARTPLSFVISPADNSASRSFTAIPNDEESGDHSHFLGDVRLVLMVPLSAAGR